MVRSPHPQATLRSQEKPCMLLENLPLCSLILITSATGHQAPSGHTWAFCCLNGGSGPPCYFRRSHACFGKDSHWAVILVAGPVAWGWAGLGWAGPQPCPPGHLLPELYTRMTQHKLWPECKTMTKADHLETL